MTAVSPLAPANFPDLVPIAGVRLATYAAGLRYKGRADLMLAELVEGSTIAAVFTTSLCPSAPVDWCRRILPDRRVRAIVCNAGNANAFTGSAGDTSAALTATTIAGSLGVEPNEVYLASTGVIGETLPDAALVEGLQHLGASLGPSDSTAWNEAADAIRTTDTFAKGSMAAIAGGGSVVGFAKGSGMIAPDMATMLGFCFTDRAVASDVLQDVLADATVPITKLVTVDSDTSTSDTVLLVATGQDPTPPITSLDDPAVAHLRAAVGAVCLDLAHQIVRDGEGATKFVAVTVTDAVSDESAATIARSIANSPLVKTAIAAEDANWGRLVMAVGKAGQPASRDDLAIWIGPEQCAVNGLVHPEYNETRATEHLQGDELEIRVSVGVGDGQATVWTCDLTHGYIDINAGYRS